VGRRGGRGGGGGCDCRCVIRIVPSSTSPRGRNTTAITTTVLSVLIPRRIHARRLCGRYGLHNYHRRGGVRIAHAIAARGRSSVVGGDAPRSSTSLDVPANASGDHEGRWLRICPFSSGPGTAM
jgi:hypothetical protein